MSSANYVLEASRSFLPGRGIVVVLKVFVDESGTHDTSPVIAVGAVYAKPSVWAAWTKDWNIAKRPVSVYHAVDCHNRAGEYKGWSAEDRDKHVRECLAVFPKHEVHGRVAALHIASYNEQVADRKELAEAFGSPYGACLQWAMTDICEQALKFGHKRVSFIHEENDFRDTAGKAYRFIRQRFPQISATFGWGAKSDYVPLQGADIVAYEGNHRYRDFSRPWRKPLEAIDPFGDKIGYIGWGKEDMPIFIRQMATAYDRFRPAA